MTAERRKLQNEELHNSYYSEIKSRKMRLAENKECVQEFLWYISIKFRRIEDNLITELSIGRISLGNEDQICMLKEVQNSRTS